MTPKKSEYKPPRPPKTLQKAGKQLWIKVNSEYVIESEHHQRNLEGAGLMLDRASAAREQIEQHGLLVADRFGQLRENPACATERAALNSYRLLLREIGLDGAEEIDNRPPRIKGAR